MEFVVSSDKKLLPYGMMNFADIRLDGYYYVDKTMYIPLIERSNRYFSLSVRVVSAKSDAEYAVTLL